MPDRAKVTSEVLTTDFLVIGSGVAGLRAAIELAREGEVLVITKDKPTESSTEYAQGGVAVALSRRATAFATRRTSGYSSRRGRSG